MAKIIYAATHCPHIYESASYTMSLHSTKKAAFKAVLIKRYKFWQERRDFCIMYGGKYFDQSHIFESFGLQEFELNE